jgi:hypothetical protein
MKLALLIGLSADKRSGRPLTPELEPFDQALAKFKGMVEKGMGAAPHVELWAGGRVAKSARFKVVEGEGVPVEVAEELTEKVTEEVPVEIAEEFTEKVTEEVPVDVAEEVTSKRSKK